MMNGNCLDAITSRLRDAGVEYELLDHPHAATTSEAAAAEGVSGYEFAKAVVLLADNLPQLHVLRAPDQVDLKSVQTTQPVHDVRLAREGDFAYLFPGCEGSLPPIPMSPNLPVRVDQRLLENERLTFEVGDGTHAIRLRTEDYLRLVEAEIADFAEVPRRRRRLAPPPEIAWGRWARRGAFAAGLVSTAAVLGRPARRLMGQPAARSFVLGAASGAATSILADPRSGDRRRHLLWERASRLVRRSRWWMDKKQRYWRGRAEGLRHEMGGPDIGGPEIGRMPGD